MTASKTWGNIQWNAVVEIEAGEGGQRLSTRNTNSCSEVGATLLVFEWTNYFVRPISTIMQISDTDISTSAP